MSVKPIPDGFHSITPMLCVDDARAAADYYQRAFSATEIMPPMQSPDGKIMHGELKIGTSIFFYCDEIEQFQTRSPKSFGGSPASMYVYVENADQQYETALAAGGTSVMEPTDMFWGDRCATLIDPFGYQWTLATHTQDLSLEEIGRRMEAEFSA